MLLTLAEVLTVVCATLFAGAAIYINVVEHPARMSFTTETAVSWWAPGYKRATLMQAPLAIAGFVFGLLEKWGHLHAVRSVVSVVASLALVIDLAVKPG